MKFSILTLTLLTASSSVSAYWWHPKPTPTVAYPGYPTPTPTPSGSPHYPKPDHPKPKPKKCLKTCFQEVGHPCAPGWKAETIVIRHKQCHTCCLSRGGNNEYKRNMGQAVDEWA